MGDAPVFVVGAGRSGTTLLRLMLDAHPSFALPTESHFVVALASPRLGLENRPEAALERVLEHPRFGRWDLDPDRVRTAVAERRPATFADLVRVVFETYAQSRGKPRWGDKTPGYVEHLPLLARLFPDARFVHLIRDGRSVAASVASMPWGPPNAVSAAYWWRALVRRGRRDGSALGDRYLEVRYEALVSNPTRALTLLCQHLDTNFDAGMLDYWRTAASRLPAGLTTPGQQHARTVLPPAPGPDRFMTLGASERRAVEHVCRPLLLELGYPTDPGSALNAVGAWTRWCAGVPGRAPNAITDRVRPARRSI